MKLLELLRQLTRQQTVAVGNSVANIHGAAAQVVKALSESSTATWLVAGVNAGELLSIDDWYTAYFAQQVRQHRAVSAIAGVAYDNGLESLKLVRGVVDVPVLSTVVLTVDTVNSTAPWAVYVNGVLQRRGVAEGTIPLGLDAGVHEIEVLALSREVYVAVPDSTAILGGLDRPRRPVFASATTGYLDAAQGTAGNTLAWFVDNRVGGWRLLRRSLTSLGQVASVGLPDFSGIYSLGITGNLVTTASVRVGDEIHVGQELAGTVVSVNTDENALSSTVLRVRLPSERVTVDLGWANQYAATGRFTEIAAIRRTSTTGQVTYADTNVVVGASYAYTLQAFGLFDEGRTGPFADPQYIATGDVRPPADITFLAGYPKSQNKRGVVRFHTPADADYRGVRVYFRRRITGAAIAGSTATTLAAGQALAGVDSTYTVRITGIGARAGQVRQVSSVTGAGASTVINLDAATPWQTTPLDTDPYEVWKDELVMTDLGRPDADDELTFAVEQYGAGRYVFRTYDHAGNEQPSGYGLAWDYTLAQDTYTGTPGTVGVFRAVVTAGTVDLFLKVEGGAYNATATIHEDSPANAAIVTHSFTASGQEIGPSDYAALNDRALFAHEVRNYWARIVDANGTITYAQLSVDRDALPEADVTLDDYRIDQKPIIHIRYDEDVSQVTVHNDGLTKVKTYSGLSGGGLVSFQVGVTAWDDLTVDTTVARNLSRTYEVRLTGGGVTRTAWRNVVHGPSDLAPTGSVRVVLAADQATADVFITPLQGADQAELFAVWIKDSESSGAVFSQLCDAAGTLIYVASGTEVGPSNYFLVGSTPTQLLNDIPLIRDRITRRYYAVSGQTSGILGPLNTIMIEAKGTPWLESIDLVFDDATDELRLKAVGGAFCQSARFEIDDTANFSSPAVNTVLTLADGGVNTATMAVAGGDRNKVWYGRVSPFNAAAAGGLGGQPHQDTEFVPPVASSGTPPGTVAVFRAVVTSGTVDLFLKAEGGTYNATATIHEDSPANAAIVTHAFTATGQEIGPTEYAALNDRALFAHEVRNYWARIVDANGVINYAQLSVDRDALPEADVTVDDFKLDGTPVIHVRYDEDVTQVTVHNAGLTKVKTYSGLSGGGLVSFQVGVTAWDDLTVDGACVLNESRTYEVRVTGGGVTRTAWRNVVHGPSANAPTVEPRVVLSTNQDTADLFLKVIGHTSELLRVWIKDSESAGAPSYGLCDAGGSPRYVASGTELGPTDYFFVNPNAVTLLNDIALTRDRVTRRYVYATGQTTGVQGPIQTVVLESKGTPWLESIDLVFDDVTDELRLKAVGGAFCQSARFEIDDVSTFASPAVNTVLSLADGGVNTATMSVLSGDRNKVWYGRVTPFNGAAGAGLAGQPHQDTEFVPPQASTATPPGASPRIRAVVTGATADIFIRTDGGVYNVAAAIYFDDPTKGSPDVSHTFTASGQEIGPANYAALNDITLPSDEVRNIWARLTDANGTINWAQASVDRDALPEADVTIDDFKIDGTPVIHVRYDEDTSQVTIHNAGLTKVKTYGSLSGGGVVSFQVGVTAWDDASVDGALGLNETRTYEVRITGGGTTKTIWRNTVHGYNSNSPQIEPRVEGSTASNTVDLYLKVTGQTVETLRVYVKDSEAAAAPIWGLVVSGADSTPRHVSSGTELGPADWFHNGTTFSQVLNDIALVRDQIKRRYVRASTQSTGLFGPWQTVTLELSSQPWIESVDMSWNQGTNQLDVKVVGGARCVSARIEIDDNTAFSSPDLNSVIALSDGQMQTTSLAISSSNRNKAWYVRVTPYSAAAAGGVAGAPVQDTVWIPITDADMLAKAMGVDVGNLVVNGGGQDGTLGAQATSWTFEAGNALVVADDDFYFGDRALKLVNGSGVDSYSSQVASGTIKAGWVYRLSGWIRTTGMSGATAQIDALNATGLTGYEILYRSHNGSNNNEPRVGVTTDVAWTYVEVVFRVTGADGTMKVYCQLNGVGNAWFDGVKLEVATLNVSALSAIAANIGTIIAGILRNGANTAALRLSASGNSLPTDTDASWIDLEPPTGTDRMLNFRNKLTFTKDGVLSLDVGSTGALLVNGAASFDGSFNSRGGAGFTVPGAGYNANNTKRTVFDTSGSVVLRVNTSGVEATQAVLGDFTRTASLTDATDTTWTGTDEANTSTVNTTVRSVTIDASDSAINKIDDDDTFTNLAYDGNYRIVGKIRIATSGATVGHSIDGYVRCYVRVNGTSGSWIDKGNIASSGSTSTGADIDSTVSFQATVNHTAVSGQRFEIRLVARVFSQGGDASWTATCQVLMNDASAANREVSWKYTAGTVLTRRGLFLGAEASKPSVSIEPHTASLPTKTNLTEGEGYWDGSSTGHGLVLRDDKDLWIQRRQVLKVLTSDVSTTSQSFQPVTGLTFDVYNGDTYVFEGDLSVANTTGSAGIVVRMAPGTATASSIIWQTLGPSGTSGNWQSQYGTSGDPTTVYGNGTASVAMRIRWYAVISGDGTYQLQLRCAAASNNVVVRAGSMIWMTRV